MKSSLAPLHTCTEPTLTGGKYELQVPVRLKPGSYLLTKQAEFKIHVFIFISDF
jgi:hypothetical protein